MVLQRAGFEIGALGPTSTASAGLNQLLKTGYLRSWGWRYALPSMRSADLINTLVEEIERRETLEARGIPVTVDEFSQRIAGSARQLDEKRRTKSEDAPAVDASPDVPSATASSWKEAPLRNADTPLRRQIAMSLLRSIQPVVQAAEAFLGSPIKSGPWQEARFVGMAFGLTNLLARALSREFPTAERPDLARAQVAVLQEISGDADVDLAIKRMSTERKVEFQAGFDTADKIACLMMRMDEELRDDPEIIEARQMAATASPDLAAAGVDLDAEYAGAAAMLVVRLLRQLAR